MAAEIKSTTLRSTLAVKDLDALLNAAAEINSIAGGMLDIAAPSDLTQPPKSIPAPVVASIARRTRELSGGILDNLDRFRA